MFLHNGPGQSSFYIQASTDFVVVAHPKHDHTTNSETVLLERILESRSSRRARDEHLRQASDATFNAGVHAVPAVSAVPPTASNNFDPEEKQEVKYGRTQYGLQVVCHNFPPPPLAGPTMDVDVVERTPPFGHWLPPPRALTASHRWFSIGPLLPRAGEDHHGEPTHAHHRGSKEK